jgi:OOP family OmpA-OmpF porin
MSNRSRICALVLPALSVLLLNACATSSIPQANETNLSGDDFNHQLARNYRDFANFEANEMYDWSDAALYADKAMAAAAGTPPSPDDMSGRSIKGADKVAELRKARSRLMAMLAAGAAQKVPADAASAQANFDCWVEQQEEGWQVADIAACKDEFWRAMQMTETAMLPEPAPRPTAQIMPAQPAAAAAPQSTAYLVFFDWNKSTLTADANLVIERAVRSLAATGGSIHLIGHTDSSGSDAYNMKLSQRRAEMVRKELIARGVAPSNLTIEWVGEGRQRVLTANGVRESRNRWVGIDIQTSLTSR